MEGNGIKTRIGNNLRQFFYQIPSGGESKIKSPPIQNTVLKGNRRVVSHSYNEFNLSETSSFGQRVLLRNTFSMKIIKNCEKSNETVSVRKNKEMILKKYELRTKIFAALRATRNENL